MELIAIKKVIEQVEKNKKVALVTVTKASGTSPAKLGLNMAVLEDKSTFGTVGGGGVEFKIIDAAFEQLEDGKSTTYLYKGENAEVEVLIRVFNDREKLLIVGGGHVGQALYKIANLQKFYTVVFDSREEFANRDIFPDADEIHLGDVEKNLENYKIDNRCYIVACGPTHAHDEMTIKKCIDRGAKYLGMLGSKRKIANIKKNLNNEGIENESLDKVYAPIGINTGGDSVSEIAFGIFGEILAVKNDCKINHMKDIKK